MEAIDPPALTTTGLPTPYPHTARSTVPPAPGEAPATPAQIDLQQSFSTAAAAIEADVGIAVAGPTHAAMFGTWQTGPAWSTIKVPIAVAAVRADPEQADPLVRRAITASSNPAAEDLWDLLGAGQTAATKVEGVLREGGDATTRVLSVRTRPEFSVYGQTQWALLEQARFAASLPCLPKASAVIEDMGELVAEHQWGLAEGGALAAKGGWGPDRAGRYLVRQFAVLPTASGALGVALAAEPHDGTFESGRRAIGQLAQWVRDNSAHFRGARTCP